MRQMSLRAGNGSGDGGHCLAIGAGDAGRCLLTRLAGSSVVEARYCDVTVEPLPPAAFDVVHARLVLGLLPEHGQVLRKLVGAVRLGGWLLVEDLDWATPIAPHAAPEATRLAAEAVLRALGARGYDPRYGRRLPSLLRREGLAEVTSIARPIGGRRDEPAWEGLVDRLAPALLGRRLLDRGDLDTLLGTDLQGIHECVTPVVISAWGHRERPTGRAEPGMPAAGAGRDAAEGDRSGRWSRSMFESIQMEQQEAGKDPLPTTTGGTAGQ